MDPEEEDPTALPAEITAQATALPTLADQPPAPPIEGPPVPNATMNAMPALKTGETEQTVDAQKALDDAKAQVELDKANTAAQIAKDNDEDMRAAHADYLTRRQAADQALDARVQEFDRNRKIEDPRLHTDMGRATLSVIFGGLGAAQRSAGGGSAENTALTQLQEKWHADTERQKANIALMGDSVAMHRARVNDIDSAQTKLRTEANAVLVAKYDSAIRQGEAQLRKVGLQQPQIDADRRLAQLRAGRAAAVLQAQKDADAHSLNQARIGWMNARAAKARKAAAGGGGGGGAGQNGMAKLARYAEEHPGDRAGLHQLAGTLTDIKDKSKAVRDTIGQSKATEAESKSAEFARAGLRSLDGIEKSGYVPTEADTQKWLNNQRDVYQAQEAGKGGGIMGLVGARTAGAMQSLKLMARAETDGLSPKAAEYFANVRRVMEPLGRAKSGAAISQGEWTNFFNQYGPQSSGGFAAARADLSDLLRSSGVAGRQQNAGDKKAAPSAGTDSEAVAWAKKNLADPRARKILKANGL